MKTIEKNEVSEEKVKDLKKQNTLLKWVVVVQSIIIIILLIFFVLGCNKSKKYERENNELKFNIHLLTDLCGSMKNEICALKEADKTLSRRMDSLEIRVSKLESDKKDSEAIISSLKNENIKLRKKIRDLMLNVDSLENVPAREIIIDTCMTEEAEVDTTDVYSKNLVVSMVKKTFNRRGNVILNDTILFNNSPVDYTFKGFALDILSGCYYYVNKKNERVALRLNSKILGNNISLNFIEKNQDSGDKKFLLNKSTDILIGARGLFFTKEGKPIEAGYSHKFYERTSNPKKGGTGEIIAGVLTTTAGIGGMWYFFNHPVSEINVYLGDNLFFTDKTWNTFGKVVSVAAIAGGTYLIIDGCWGKFHYKITPTEVAFHYNLTEK